jgi:lysozyme
MRLVNAAGMALIKASEGFRADPYQDSTGKWTIGYGHTLNVSQATSPINKMQAEAFLSQDLAGAQVSVERLVQVSLTDNQYAALVSLVFNVGTAPLRKTLGEKLNAGDYAGAADEFNKWIYAGGMSSAGLVARRAAEKSLFISVS